ncbi:MAG: hypothetical protein ABSA47_02475, partial [Verrucomicrobiota bacterium]
MSASAKMAWSGLVGGAIFLGAQGACLAAAADVSPPAARAARAAQADAEAPEAPAAASDEENSNPYFVIIDRNVFRLNPPPIAEPKDPKPPPDLPEVKLAGFEETGDHLDVLLQVKVKSRDPKVPESVSYLTLAEGERANAGESGREVVEEMVKVYADQEKIDIINAGTPMTLSMKDNGFGATAPAAAPGGRGGTPAILNRTIPPPGAPPPAGPSPMGAAPMGGNNSAGSTMVAGGVGTLSRPTFGGGLSTSGGSSTIVGGGGGTGLSTGFQTTQPAFSGLSSSRSSYNGETLVAGGYQPPAASVTQTPAIP